MSKIKITITVLFIVILLSATTILTIISIKNETMQRYIRSLRSEEYIQRQCANEYLEYHKTAKIVGIVPAYKVKGWYDMDYPQKGYYIIAYELESNEVEYITIEYAYLNDNYEFEFAWIKTELRDNYE